MVDKKYSSMWGEWFLNVVNGPYGVILWENIRRGWEIFLGLLDLRLVIVLKLGFHMIYGSGKHVLKDAFPNYNVLLTIKRLERQTTCNVVVATFIGISVLLELCKIWSWRRQKCQVFKVKTFYKVLSPMKTLLSIGRAFGSPRFHYSGFLCMDYGIQNRNDG